MPENTSLGFFRTISVRWLEADWWIAVGEFRRFGSVEMLDVNHEGLILTRHDSLFFRQNFPDLLRVV